MALLGEDLAWPWGQNTQGQIGNRSTSPSVASPVQVQFLRRMIGLSASTHVLTVDSNGFVWGWGYNGYGQLGAGSAITYQIAPLQIAGISNVTAVAAGAFFSLALRADGTVWAWGLNDSGQLGDGTTTLRTSPVQVPGLTDVMAISAGNNQSAALRSDGTVWTWGLNSTRQLGIGTQGGFQGLVPVQVPGLSGGTAVGAGVEHAVAVLSDGTALAWGGNLWDQIGDGVSGSRLSAGLVPMP